MTKKVITPNGHRKPKNPDLERELQALCKVLSETGQAPSDIMEMAMELDEKVVDLGLIGALEVLMKTGIKLHKTEQAKYEGIKDGR